MVYNDIQSNPNSMSKNLTYSNVSNKIPTINAEIDLGYWWALLSSSTSNKSKSPSILSLNLKPDQNTQLRIRSKVEITSEFIPSPQTYRYQHDNIKAIVGEAATQHPLELIKTHEPYRILTYTLISQLVQTNQPTLINLTINYPLNIYNQKTKQDFESYIRTPDFINIFLNSQQKTFHIQNCLTFPQCIPVAYANPHKFKSQTRAIIDIGGYTAQGVILDNLNIIPNTIFSETLGCHNLYNRIRQILNSKFSTNIQDYEMPNIIQFGLTSHPKESLSEISKIINSHINEIIKHTKIKNWNISNIPILFTGGGSLVMKSQLLSQFPLAELSADPLHDNLKGLRQVGESIYD